MNEDKTLTCPKCGAYSLEMSENEETEESCFQRLHCFNCGFDISDEEYQSMIFNTQEAGHSQERIDALDREIELPNIIQNLNFNLQLEELEKVI